MARVFSQVVTYLWFSRLEALNHPTIDAPLSLVEICPSMDSTLDVGPSLSMDLISLEEMIVVSSKYTRSSTIN
jgi:hypothetical protein